MVRYQFAGKIIGCAIEEHRVLGPGLLESTYQQCLAHELLINFNVQRLADGIDRFKL